MTPMNTARFATGYLSFGWLVLGYRVGLAEFFVRFLGHSTTMQSLTKKVRFG
jgi:hypothetical protein